MEVINAEQKVINSVYELLDERWLSKEYRLFYKGDDTEMDLSDCLALLGDRLHFHSITCSDSFLPVFSKFRLIKMEIEYQDNLSQFFEHIPHSVAELTLNVYSALPFSFKGDCIIRKFRNNEEQEEQYINHNNGAGKCILLKPPNNSEITGVRFPPQALLYTEHRKLTSSTMELIQVHLIPNFSNQYIARGKFRGT
ncbi:hypothetical protein FGO68_gene8262 [Halteria grandinella]|uniref:Uncharacterized protein n=1 Tax=Halteria grandinella TaxID=5974 RepID=A0A8J8T8C3_HALGN|nr:hypothetical protein FGO68_gene8262 [Halteria grandinella]